MNEIEKLYKNAKIFCLHPSGFCKYIGATCERCERHKYPSFTAEKQLELIKWLADRPLPVLIGKYKGKYYFGNTEFNSKVDVFDNALARRLNEYWDSLTKEEKEQIKEILILQ